MESAAVQYLDAAREILERFAATQLAAVEDAGRAVSLEEKLK